MKTISWFFLHFVQTTIENAIIFTLGKDEFMYDIFVLLMDIANTHELNLFVIIEKLISNPLH